MPPSRSLVGWICALALSACTPHVSQVSQSTITRLRKNSTPPPKTAFQNGELHAHYPIRLPDNTVLRIPLHKTHQIPTIQAELNNVPMPWMIDTGAAYPVLIDAESASSAQLPILKNTKVKGSGVGGNTDALLGQFQTLSSDGHTLIGPGIAGILLQSYHFAFAGIPIQRMPLNLIGLPLLEQFSFVTIDIPGEEMVMAFHHPFVPPKNAVSFPFHNSGGRLWITLKVGGQDIRAFFDTGCGSTLRLACGVLEKLPQSAFSNAPRHERRAMGVGGVEIEEVGILNEAQLGEIRIAPVEYDTSNACTETMLGLAPFQKNRTTIDFKRQRVWVEPAAAPSTK